MFKYTIKRVLQSLGTVLIVVSIVSLLLSLMPTDYYFTEEQLIKLTDKQKEDQLAAAGLLDSPIVQLFRFLENLILKFDLGTSRRIQAGVPVIKVIGDKFAISMRLGCIALAIFYMVLLFILFTPLCDISNKLPCFLRSVKFNSRKQRL